MLQQLATRTCAILESHNTENLDFFSSCLAWCDVDIVINLSTRQAKLTQVYCGLLPVS